MKCIVLLALAFSMIFGAGQNTVIARPGDQPLSVSKDETKPAPLNAPLPNAGGCAFDGSQTTRISLIVTVSGKPKNEVVSISSGNKCLDAQAIKTVQNYRFRPAKHEGIPVETSIRIDVNFQRY